MTKNNNDKAKKESKEMKETTNKTLKTETKSEKVGKKEEKSKGKKVETFAFAKNDIIVAPSLTEKSINMVEFNNTLVFFVKRKARKAEIKDAVEKMFDVKVEKVRTLIPLGRHKKAYVRLSKEYRAVDVAAKLGMI